MKNFKIIPVIDILKSNAVHAKKGERTKYKPLKSYLFQTSNPIEIIKKLKQEFNLFEYYIADLDSIIHKTPNFQIIKEITKIPEIEIMLDPGITDLRDILQFNEFKIKNLILGLETIKSFKIIKESLQLLNSANLIISIDMYKEKIISKALGIKKNNLFDFIKNIYSEGIRKIILLDLYRVGQKVGGIPPIYLDILHNFDGDILVGGGIKDHNDILNYKEKNFAGVLIATALYDGTIDREKLRNL
jgi:phosphoribosylformimino-5-aminoimidazole carboxamide ribotide isomerase